MTYFPQFEHEEWSWLFILPFFHQVTGIVKYPYIAINCCLNKIF